MGQNVAGEKSPRSLEKETHRAGRILEIQFQVSFKKYRETCFESFLVLEQFICYGVGSNYSNHEMKMENKKQAEVKILGGLCL